MKDIRLDPEENRINYRARHVRHLQHRVMDHIFRDRRFELKDLDQLARWMCNDKSEMAFFNSRLIAVNMGRLKDAKFSHATIASLAHAMIQMLTWVLNTYSDMAVQAVGFKALTAMQGIEKNANKNARVMMKRKGYLEKETYLIPLSMLQQLIESKEHSKALEKAMYVLRIKMHEERMEHAESKWDRDSVYNLQCHMCVLLTLHTGKRPGVLCGVKLGDIVDAQKFVAKKTGDESFLFNVVPACPYAVFNTVAMSTIHVSEHVLHLLDVLVFLRQHVDNAKRSDRLFTSCNDLPLGQVHELLMKCWKDANCKGRFNSIMMRHTIITASQDPVNRLTEEEIKALVRGMDYSVRMARMVYNQNKEKMQIDHSAIIRKVLKMNDWDEELKTGVEEEIEFQCMEGELEPIEPEKNQDEDDDDEEEDGRGKKKNLKMISNRKVIFTNESELKMALFRDFIMDKVVNPGDSIKNDVMSAIYYNQMGKLPDGSPYKKLLKYEVGTIMTKVRTLITSLKRKKNSEAKRKEGYKNAHLKKAAGKNPKL